MRAQIEVELAGMRDGCIHYRPGRNVGCFPYGLSGVLAEEPRMMSFLDDDVSDGRFVFPADAQLQASLTDTLHLLVQHLDE